MNKNICNGCDQLEIDCECLCEDCGFDKVECQCGEESEDYND